MPTDELKRKIEEETRLIAELEASYPEYNSTVGRYHELNRAWFIHHTAVRDAYWRRRMFQAKLDGDDLNETAKVY